MKVSSGLQLRAERRIFCKMFRKTFQVISEASAAGRRQLRCPPGVAWRTFRSQGRFSSGSCSRCWRPQTVEGRRNTFKSVLPKLGSSVLSLHEHVVSKEARLSVALWWNRCAQARCVSTLFFHLASCWLCTSLGWRCDSKHHGSSDLKEILFPALDEFIFPTSICFNRRAVRTLSYPLFPRSLPLLSLRSLFGLQWNFDARPLLHYGELNMPCRDLLSAATFILPASGAALKPLRKCSVLWKTYHSDVVYRDSLVGCFSALFWVSIVNIFISLTAALALFERYWKSNYCQPLKASSSICLNLFLKDTLFCCVWTDVKTQPHLFDIFHSALVECVCVGSQTEDGWEVFSESMAAFTQAWSWSCFFFFFVRFLLLCLWM